MTRPEKIPSQAGFEPQIFRSRADALTTRLARRCKKSYVYPALVCVMSKPSLDFTAAYHCALVCLQNPTEQLSFDSPTSFHGDEISRTEWALFFYTATPHFYPRDHKKVVVNFTAQLSLSSWAISRRGVD